MLLHGYHRLVAFVRAGAAASAGIAPRLRRDAARARRFRPAGEGLHVGRLRGATSRRSSTRSRFRARSSSVIRWARRSRSGWPSTARSASCGLVLDRRLVPKPGNAGLREFRRVGRDAHRSDRPAFVREFQESTVAKPVAPALIDTAVRESLRCRRASGRRRSSRSSADLSSELNACSVPTLLVWGDRDAFVPPQRTGRAHGRDRRLDARRLPRRRPQPPLGGPGAVRRRVSAFVQRLDTRTHTTQGAK